MLRLDFRHHAYFQNVVRSYLYLYCLYLAMDFPQDKDSRRCQLFLACLFSLLTKTKDVYHRQNTQCIED